MGSGCLLAVGESCGPVHLEDLIPHGDHGENGGDAASSSDQSRCAETEFVGGRNHIYVVVGSLPHGRKGPIVN